MYTVAQLLIGLEVAAWCAAIACSALVLKSIVDFTRTGPQVRKEIVERFKLYTIYAVSRLAFWAFIFILLMMSVGSIVYFALSITFGLQVSILGYILACLGACTLICAVQFCRHLLYIPSSICISFQYRLDRLYPIWKYLSPTRLSLALTLLALAAALPIIYASALLIIDRQWGTLMAMDAFALGISLIVGLSAYRPRRGPPTASHGGRPSMPNVLMIGSDTLRLDRLGATRYFRNLTPFIDELSERGWLFTNCYVPLARTAPSLASLLTGAWPHRHGLRDNFVKDEDTRLQVSTLPEILSRHGYATFAVSDWAGSDLGKMRFGFDQAHVPPDQWNFKYYLRQGPMDLRLFVSLFTHNRFGRRFLPEIFWQAGIPMGGFLDDRTRQCIGESLARGKPFFLNLFFGTTHVPFGSRYPYYTMFSPRDHQGDSKFVMSKFADPMEIIIKQEADQSSFDVSQIINLYDGCVKQFDDEVARVMHYLEACDIVDNTIIVIYSDHGADFFENNTWGQGNTILGSDPGARIPLLIIDPRRKGGETVDRVTRSVDLMPTLLQLLDLPVPPTVDGTSLVPYMERPGADLALAAMQETGIWFGAIPGLHPDHITYPRLLDLLEVPDIVSGTLAIKPEFENLIVTAKDRMLRTERWKLTYQPLVSGAKYMLFDVIEDPECRVDIGAEHPDILSGLKEQLQAWIKEDPKRRWTDEHIL